jgi:hypothetical protein
MGDGKPYFRDVAGHIRLPAPNSRPVLRLILFGHENQRVSVEFSIVMALDKLRSVSENTRYIHNTRDLGGLAT